MLNLLLFSTHLIFKFHSAPCPLIKWGAVDLFSSSHYRRIKNPDGNLDKMLILIYNEALAKVPAKRPVPSYP